MFGGPLRPLLYRPTQEDGDWSESSFYDSREALQKLSGLNVASSEGLETYCLSDPNAVNYTTEQAKAMHKSLVGMGQAGLQANSIRNSENLVGVLSEDDLIEMGISLPAFRRDGAEKYNSVADAIDKNVAVSKQLKEDPNAVAEYLLSGLGGEESPSYQFFARHVQNLLKGHAERTQFYTLTSLKTYGAKDFVNQNIDAAKTLQSYSPEEEAKQREIAEVRQAVETLTGDEKIAKMKEAEEVERSYLETYKENNTARRELPQMIGAIEDTAYEKIKNRNDEGSSSE